MQTHNLQGRAANQRFLHAVRSVRLCCTVCTKRKKSSQQSKHTKKKTYSNDNWPDSRNDSALACHFAYSFESSQLQRSRISGVPFRDFPDRSRVNSMSRIKGRKIMQNICTDYPKILTAVPNRVLY